jgi:hypothetical protein
LLLSLPAAAQFRHYSLDGPDARPLPRKIVILPPEVIVRELSAGGVAEKVPEWTDQAGAALTKAAKEFAGRQDGYVLVDMPTLSQDERDELEEYSATLYSLALGSVLLSNYRSGAWNERRRKFDFSMGEGLPFLAEKSGAGAALFIIGEDLVSTPGRRALAVLGAALGAAVGMGSSVVVGVVVDLKTGDLLWTNHTTSKVRDLKDDKGAMSMIGGILDSYPTAPRW